MARMNEEIEGRAATYRLLGQLYRKELGATLAGKLVDAEIVALLGRYGYEIPEDFAQTENLAAIRREFTRVFLGPAEHVSPYGSVHHPDDLKRGRLWGDTTTQVRAFAKDHGLDFGGDAYDGIPDHVGHELELFALLLEAEAAARAAGDEGKAERLRNSQRYLHGKHMARWVPLFCAAVEERASGFYRPVARMTRELLEADADRLSQS